MSRMSVMRIIALVAGLVLANAGLIAQMRDFSETNPWPGENIIIGLPENDDDEGDDEGADCPTNQALVPRTGQT